MYLSPQSVLNHSWTAKREEGGGIVGGGFFVGVFGVGLWGCFGGGGGGVCWGWGGFFGFWLWGCMETAMVGQWGKSKVTQEESKGGG